MLLAAVCCFFQAWAQMGRWGSTLKGYPPTGVPARVHGCPSTYGKVWHAQRRKFRPRRSRSLAARVVGCLGKVLLPWREQCGTLGKPSFRKKGANPYLSHVRVLRKGTMPSPLVQKRHTSWSAHFFATHVPLTASTNPKRPGSGQELSFDVD